MAKDTVDMTVWLKKLADDRPNIMGQTSSLRIFMDGSYEILDSSNANVIHEGGCIHTDVYEEPADFMLINPEENED